MGLGSRFIKADFGVKVLQQTVAGTYIAPTKILCLEKGKAKLPDIDYGIYNRKPMDDVEYDVITDAESAKVSISFDLALPVNASLGGVEDLLLACGMTKTTVVSDIHFKPQYDFGGLGISLEVTTKRRVYEIKDAKGSFELDFQPGEMARVKFNMTGTLNGTPTELAPATADNTIPVNDLQVADVIWAKKNCGITVGANPVWAKGVMLDLGRQIQNEPTFCSDAVIDSGMKPTTKITMKMTEQNEAPIADMANGTEYALVVPAYNSANVNKFNITVPKGKVTTPDNETDTNGYWDVERTFSMMKSVADDNFELVFLA